MATTRVVKGKVLGANVEQKEGNRVQIRIDEVTAGDDSVRFPSSVDAQTDANGEFRVPLLVNQQYTAALPDGSEKTFFVPAGEGEADLSDLVGAIAASLTEAYRFEAFVSNNLERLVKPILDDAAANVTAGAAGTSAVPLAGGPNALLGNDGDVGIDPNTGFVYKKASGLWGEPIGSIKGPPGLPGDPGSPGNPGAPGDPGNPGENAFVHIAYAQNDAGDGFSQTPDTYSSHTAFYPSSDPNYPPQEAFTNWLQTQGPPGSDAIGEEGTSSYTFVRYAEDASGTGFTSTPQSVSTHFALIAKADPTPPTLAELSGLWISYGTSTTGAYAPPPPLHVKLSAITQTQFALSMQSNRAHVIERDAAKSVVFTETGDAGRADVTFIAPKVGTVHPVSLVPAVPGLVFTDRRGYADNYLFKSFQDKVYARPSLLEFPYNPQTAYWTPNALICYLFEAANQPLKNRVADHSHLTTNQGVVKNPYGIDLATLEFAFATAWSLSFNQPFSILVVAQNLGATAPGEGLFGFSDPNETTNYISVIMSSDTTNGKRLFVRNRSPNFNSPLQAGGETVYCYLPSDLSGLTSLLFSRDTAGRWQLRCLNNDAILKPLASAGNPDGYYPAGVSTNVYTYPTMRGSLGGTVRRTATEYIYAGAYNPRYLAAEQNSYTAAGAIAMHNTASDWIAAINPTGAQLVRK